MIKLSRLEMETTINWNAEEPTASVYSATPTTIRKLDKLCAQFPELYRCTWEDGEILAKRYTMPVELIRFAKPASEARREANRRNGYKTNSQPS